MAKTSQIKKVVNGEIADADDVNQIVENAGNEGGAIPYNPTTHERAQDASQSLGSTAYPWGSLNIEEDASLNEIASATLSPSVANTVLIKNLRRFLFLKDCPSTFSGQANKVPRVNAGETALEFATIGQAQLFTANGNFVCPSGVTKVFVTMVGGGGGGGAGYGQQGGGGGGGSGAWIIRRAVAVVGGNTYAVTVGAAGTAGAYSGGAGGNGGNSVFAGVHTLTCAGGGGGGGGTGGAGGAAGAAGAGATLVGAVGNHTSGAAGGKGPNAGNAGGAGYYGGSTNEGGGGGGGGSYFGEGGNGGANAAAGSVGTGYGSGGGGGGSSTGVGAGAAGTQGFVLIEFFA